MEVIFWLEVILPVGGSENVKQAAVVQYKVDLKPISKWWWYLISNFHMISVSGSITNCGVGQTASGETVHLGPHSDFTSRIDPVCPMLLLHLESWLFRGRKLASMEGSKLAVKSWCC